MSQKNIFTELSKHIDLLSHNLKSKYSNLSWQLDYKNVNSEETNDLAEYEINIAFKNEESVILDLQFNVDENENISIEGGLVSGKMGNRNPILVGKTQFDIIKRYLGSSKDLVYYSYCRIKSIKPIQVKDLTRTAESIKNAMVDIEVLFKLILKQSSLQATL